jgi:hypothetical protein
MRIDVQPQDVALKNRSGGLRAASRGANGNRGRDALPLSSAENNPGPTGPMNAALGVLPAVAVATPGAAPAGTP